ncbi:AMP-dependent synthetase/ligase [Kocuria palustris]|jgi:long-chain acyl-CoA synthetase|uniref:AMP-dependent synthetase/ligase n=1 Tax=Kocuria palustris TaxID=71999 RepID=UPI003B968F98
MTLTIETEPAVVAELQAQRITDLLVQRADSPQDPVLYERLQAHGSVEVTASAFRDEVRAVAKGLVAAGIEPGDRVGILSRTRYEWTLVDFAIWWAGAVPVPVYDSSSPDQIAWNLGDSQARAVFVEDERLEAAVRQAADDLAAGSLHGFDDAPELGSKLSAAERIWRLDGTGEDLSRLIGLGTAVEDDELERRRTSRGLDDTATIIYTSGTTGPPKGCELTHRSFVFLSENLRPFLPEVVRPGSRTVLFLPLAHVFARMVQVISVHGGVTLSHTPDVKSLMSDLQRVQPTFLLAVPRVFEKIMTSARLKAEGGGRLRAGIFQRAVEDAEAFSRQRQDGRVSPALKLRHRLWDRLVYAPLRNTMGGRVHWAISGGAALGEELAHTLAGMGIFVVEGYGLTETTAPVAANTPRTAALGTVGRPLPGHEMRLGEDGEIEVRGPHVLARYHGRPDLTEKALHDGWFATGDLGVFDERGMLRITGRKKEILVTAAGKNVIPDVLEGPIRTAAIVSQCMVIGDGRRFIAALITLDAELLPQCLRALGLDPSMTAAQASEHPAVIEHVQEIVDFANRRVSRAEGISAFQILPVDFTPASGHLTPSLKLRRAVILQDFAEQIEEIYSRPAPAPRQEMTRERAAQLREELRGLRERVRESSEASLERLRELRLGSQEVEDDGADQRRGEGPQGG